MTTSVRLAPLLERFFTQRLMQERRVSPHTISSYRDTFRLLLKFTHQRLHKPPSASAATAPRWKASPGQITTESMGLLELLECLRTGLREAQWKTSYIEL
jgi:site-specific recombinase XerC